MTTKSLPEVRSSRLGTVDFTKQHEWLRQHRHEYAGQWVVLDGDRLVGHSKNGKEIVEIVRQARATGLLIPFVEFIEDASLPFTGGWL